MFLKTIGFIEGICAFDFETADALRLRLTGATRFSKTIGFIEGICAFDRGTALRLRLKGATPHMQEQCQQQHS